jgi:hypothetical protein
MDGQAHLPIRPHLLDLESSLTWIRDFNGYSETLCEHDLQQGAEINVLLALRSPSPKHCAAIPSEPIFAPIGSHSIQGMLLPGLAAPVRNLPMAE